MADTIVPVSTNGRLSVEMVSPAADAPAEAGQSDGPAPTAEECDVAIVRGKTPDAKGVMVNDIIFMRRGATEYAAKIGSFYIIDGYQVVAKAK